MPAHPPPQLIDELSAPHRSLRIGVSLDAWGASVAIDPDVAFSRSPPTSRSPWPHSSAALPEEIYFLRPTVLIFGGGMAASISRELMYLTDEAKVPLTDANTSIQLRHHLALADRYNIDDLFEAQMVTEALMCRWGDFCKATPAMSYCPQ